jgi:methyl-accepting chemotaxis protein
MRVTGKLVVSYLIIAFILIGLGTYSAISLNLMNNNGQNMYENRVVPLNELASIIQLAENTRVQMVTSVLNENPALTENAEQNLKDINIFNDTYGARIVNTEERDMFETFQTSWNEFSTIVRNNINLVNNGSYQEAQAGLAEGGIPFNIASESLVKLREINEEIANNLNLENQNSFEINRLIIIIASATSVLIAIVIGVYMGRGIGAPLRQVAERMTKISQGDLTEEDIKVSRKDEIGSLATGINTMQHSLKEVIRNVSNASEKLSSQSEELTQSANEVTEGSTQISSTMQELAIGSESQANNASELSETMEFFVTKVEETNENGVQIREFSDDVLDMTNKGSGLMDSSTEQMAKIDEIVQDAVEKVRGLDASSQKIGELVSVIQEIAEQTNLLALNAAIEAARAGEHGKGFVVVADEVRKLAEGVSVSVTDITGIVDNIQKESASVTGSLQSGYQEVTRGTTQIKMTGETFKEINTSLTDMVNNIHTVTSNLSEIADMSKGMNSSIEDIAAISEESAAGTEQTSAASQQTSSAMEEVSSSSNYLAKLAEELNGLVSQFKY